MEDIGYPLPPHERYRHTKHKKYFENLELAHTNLLGTALKYRI
jgi:hypothetical protein